MQIQKDLQSEVILQRLEKPIQCIAGCDVSFDRFAPDIFAGIIVLSYPSLVPVGHVVFKTKTDFPYIPGLLSFREIPALMECWRILKDRVETLPDVVMMDGQGIAHPRGLGIATHFGILADIPTIGCAQSLLYGNFVDPEIEAGSISPISDRYDPEQIIGMAMRTKRNNQPIIVSPGYKITLQESVDVTFSSIWKHRLPEPTRLAHELVNQYRLREI